MKSINKKSCKKFSNLFNKLFIGYEGENQIICCCQIKNEEFKNDLKNFTLVCQYNSKISGDKRKCTGIFLFFSFFLVNY